MIFAATAEKAVSNYLNPDDQVVYVARWARGNANVAAGLIGFFSYFFWSQMSGGGIAIGGLMLLWAYGVWQAPKFKRVILTDRRLIFEHSFGTRHETIPVNKIEKVKVTGNYVEVVAGSIFNKVNLNLVDGRALASALDVLMSSPSRGSSS